MLSTHAGPRWLVDNATEISVLASARQRWLGTTSDNRDLGIRIETARRVTSKVTALAQPNAILEETPCRDVAADFSKFPRG